MMQRATTTDVTESRLNVRKGLSVCVIRLLSRVSTQSRHLTRPRCHGKVMLGSGELRVYYCDLCNHERAPFGRPYGVLT